MQAIRSSSSCAAVLAALVLHAAPAVAQTRTLAEIAAYQGPDRMARLIEGAKKEGTLSFYMSRVAEDSNPVIDAFRKKYGLDVQVWRGANEAVLNRILAERRAGRCGVDAISTGGTAFEAMHRENLLQAVKSPNTAEIMPQAIPPHGEYVGVGVNILNAAYNTNLVKPEELPKSYEDLTHPRWKGRLAIEADDVDWFAGVVSSMGEEKGLKLFKEIAQRNGMSFRKGHTLLANLIAAGEVPFGLAVYRYKPEQLMAAGAPVRSLYLPPVVAFASSIAVAGCAPHPNAAVLMFEFMLREGQAIYAERDLVPTNPTVKPLPAGLDVTLIDPAQMLDHRAKWVELWEKTIVRPR
ncbi:MAG: iron(III) transport system substrate-binding protein [Alphaproteobacteria bacterium]|nr:iron(III) transport system substrate-binding protein [Alphaproteobacteria bacterium]